ncbi:hypothetical protein V502_04749 [Pseudogymnoascus sp. VKM F-4520 (FW-2644)]|nr:hypothetical protein V502_04749 [Pseudogymnoascus sp. VKM F-4520 (FW-2644)]
MTVGSPPSTIKSTLPAELTKRAASLAMVEARVKELEAELAELAEPQREKQVRDNTNDKAPANRLIFVAPVSALEPMGWFSELQAMYSYVKTCFRSSPRTSKFWTELGERTTAIENGDIAVTKELKTGVDRVKSQVKEIMDGLEKLKAQGNERCDTTEAQIKKLTESISTFRTETKGRNLETEVKAKDLTVVTKEFKAQIMRNKLETDAQINRLYTWFSGIAKQGREKSLLKEEKRGQSRSAQEATKKLESENRSAQSDEEYDVVQMPVIPAEEV